MTGSTSTPTPMRRHGARRWLPWIPFGFTIALLAGTVVLLSLYRASGAVDPDGSMITVLLLTLVVFAFAGVGALTSSRYPANRIGWLCAGIALAWATAGFGLGYINYSLNVNALPGARFIVLTQALWNVGFVAPATLLPLRFPTGKTMGGRWKWIERSTLGWLAILFVSAGVAPETVYRPLGRGFEIQSLRPAMTTVVNIAYLALFLLAVFALASVIIRFRRADWRERQQLKWLIYAVALLVILMVISSFVELAGVTEVANLVAVVGFGAVPIAIGMAILRHGLYDIDFVINRTLVYMLLSTLIGVVYFGGVAVLQGLIGLGGDSELAVAASTLVVAGLFQPARRRIQDFIDHYFYRRRYDAQRTIDAFTSRLRDEIDLSALNEELVLVVGQTMQPKHVSVWLIGEDGT
ncbi:MAG: hypothetical protein GEU78_02195 [Actinobacteria bacterium]|nr:hypothetical protein [Actinomycetota bacterium]